MEKIDKVIEILQAYKEGKNIQFKENGSWSDYIQVPLSCLLADMSKKSYLEFKVKSEPKYRPYNSAEEFLAATIKHGDWIIRKDGNAHNKIVRCSDNSISVLTEGSDGWTKYYHIKYQALCENYTFSDGTICGVIDND